MGLEVVAFGLIAFLTFVHVASIGIVSARVLFRPRTRPLPVAEVLPSVTLLRPVRGLENFLEESLRTSFHLSYRHLEIIFCVDDEDDPVVPLVRRLIAEHPSVDARLLIGRDRVGANPKLNNLVKGWNAARSEWIVMSDSNALLPPDFIEMLLTSWLPGTGVLSTAASVSQPDGFAAEIECAFVNTCHARWMLIADIGGFGFAQGRTLMWQRQTLESLGGLPVLAREAAEDVASTKALRGTGLRPSLARSPLPQAIGRRTMTQMWRRQVRWARLRRSGFPLIYPVELLMGAFIPFAPAVVLVATGAVPAWTLGAFIAGWYACEAFFAWASGAVLTPRMPLAWFARDMLLPVVWVAGFLGNSFEWRGHAMSVSAAGETQPGGKG